MSVWGRDQKSILCIWAFAFLLAIAIGLQLAMLEAELIGDERSNNDVPVNLVMYGRYATTDRREYPEQRGVGRGLEFDGYISTGPTVLVPAAFAYHLFGIGTWQVRLIPLVFYVMSLAAFYGLAKKMFNAQAALMGAWLYGTYPLVVEAGHRLLGEIAGLFFVWLSLLFFFWFLGDGRRRLLAASGLALGFAVLSKLVILMLAVGVVAVLIAGELVLGRKNPRGSAFSLLVNTALLLAMVAVPTLCFYLFIVATIGADGFYTNYASYILDMTEGRFAGAFILVSPFTWIQYIFANSWLALLGGTSLFFFVHGKSAKLAKITLLVLLVISVLSIGGLYREGLYATGLLILVVGWFLDAAVRSDMLQEKGVPYRSMRLRTVAWVLWVLGVLVNLAGVLRFVFLGEPQHLSLFDTLYSWVPVQNVVASLVSNELFLFYCLGLVVLLGLPGLGIFLLGRRHEKRILPVEDGRGFG